MKLTPRQKRFAEFYAGSGNAKQSALKAGYSESLALTQSMSLIQNKNIKEYILLLSSEQYNNRILNAKELKSILCRFIVNENEKMSDRIKAIETLNKMTGLYLEKQEREDVTNPFEELSVEELRKLLADEDYLMMENKYR